MTLRLLYKSTQIIKTVVCTQTIVFQQPWEIYDVTPYVINRTQHNDPGDHSQVQIKADLSLRGYFQGILV